MQKSRPIGRLFYFVRLSWVLRSDIGKEIPTKMQSVHKKFTCQLLCRQAIFKFRGQSRSCPLFYIMHLYCFGAQKFAVKKERRANREWRGKGEKYEKEIIYMNPLDIEVSYTKSANTILSNM